MLSAAVVTRKSFPIFRVNMVFIRVFNISTKEKPNISNIDLMSVQFHKQTNRHFLHILSTFSTVYFTMRMGSDIYYVIYKTRVYIQQV